MLPKFKIDEDLPAVIGVRLRQAGYDALTVVEQALSGSSDNEIWEVVRTEERCLLTADKGFADLRLLRGIQHRGIVLFRLQRESRSGYLTLLDLLLARLDIVDLSNSLIVVSPESIRIRHPEKEFDD